jgi:membrane-bound metal-dependent hydrolase YbcI (DUF457 family)
MEGADRDYLPRTDRLPEHWLPTLGHLAVGYAVALQAARAPRPSTSSIGLLVALVAAASVIPDLDILAAEVGIAEHRGGLHSLAMAAAVGGAIALIARSRTQPAWLWGAAAFASMASHGVLDLFSEGPGVKLLWPFSDTLFASPVRPLPAPRVFEILSPRELLPLAAEAVLFAPVVILSWLTSRRSTRRGQVS